MADLLICGAGDIEIIGLYLADLHKIRGQCYDGASAMSGSKKGVAKKTEG